MHASLQINSTLTIQIIPVICQHLSFKINFTLLGCTFYSQAVFAWDNNNEKNNLKYEKWTLFAISQKL